MKKSDGWEVPRLVQNLLNLLRQACAKDNDSKWGQENEQLMTKRGTHSSVQTLSHGPDFPLGTGLSLAVISDQSHLHKGVSLKRERTHSAQDFKIFKTLPTRNKRSQSMVGVEMWL